MKDINAATDLMETYTKSLVIAAAMTFFGMKNATDEPQQNCFNFQLHQDRNVYVFEVMNALLDQYVVPAMDELSSQAPQFQCTYCPKNYKSKNGLRRHITSKHGAQQGKSRSTTSSEASTDQDHLFNYARSAVSMGLLAMNFTDARRLGDGERLMRIYKFLLLHFKAAGKTKYSFHVLRLLAQVNCFLSPRLSHSLVWNRFVNKTGKITGNIEVDREMEHHNRVFKTQCKALRGKINAKSVERVSHSSQQVNGILCGVDEQTSFKRQSGKHVTPDNKKDVIALAMEMLSSKIYEHHPGRQSFSFPGYPPSVLGSLNVPDMIQWIQATLNKLSRQHVFRK